MKRTSSKKGKNDCIFFCLEISKMLQVHDVFHDDDDDDYHEDQVDDDDHHHHHHQVLGNRIELMMMMSLNSL